MFQKQLSCSFENKVYDNYNKVSYLEIKMLKPGNHFSEESQLFSEVMFIRSYYLTTFQIPH